ncbi:hypothetical protein T01_13891, partial [Trichinella spiralis]
MAQLPGLFELLAPQFDYSDSNVATDVKSGRVSSIAYCNLWVKRLQFCLEIEKRNALFLYFPLFKYF